MRCEDKLGGTLVSLEGWQRWGLQQEKRGRQTGGQAWTVGTLLPVEDPQPSGTVALPSSITSTALSRAAMANL